MKLLLSLLFVFSLYLSPTLAEPADPKAYLQLIYENKGGYTIPTEEIEAIRKVGGHPQYGEIPYDSAAHILVDLYLTRQDVFYDLGSGVGKLAMQVYLTTPVKRSVGIELSPTRWNIAEAARKQAKADDHIDANRDMSFLNQNIATANLSDATVCFISGITFPTALIQSVMDRLSSLEHNVIVISVLPLPPHKRFTLIRTYTLPMSWAPEGVPVCLYNVTPASCLDADSKGTKAQKTSKKKKSTH